MLTAEVVRWVGFWVYFESRVNCTYEHVRETRWGKEGTKMNLRVLI